MTSELGVRIDAIIMIDFALKLEAEMKGAIAEGVESVIGGIDVERYKTEDSN